MEVNNIYYQKYLKYKSKYIELKNSIKGGAWKNGPCMGQYDKGCIQDCMKFVSNSSNKSMCLTCKHIQTKHGKTT